MVCKLNPASFVDAIKWCFINNAFDFCAFAGRFYEKRMCISRLQNYTNPIFAITICVKILYIYCFGRRMHMLYFASTYFCWVQKVFSLSQFCTTFDACILIYVTLSFLFLFNTFLAFRFYCTLFRSQFCFSSRQLCANASKRERGERLLWRETEKEKHSKR